MELFNGIYREILAGRSLQSLWTPGKCDVIPGRKGNFVGGPVLFARIAADERTAEIVKQHCRGEIEFLPFTHDDEQYYALYLPRTYECLDLERSEFWGKEPDTSSIRTHVFIPAKVPSDLLFRLPDAFEYYCTDRFKKLVEAEKLTGLYFRRVWGEGTSPEASVESPEGETPEAQMRVTTRRRLTKRDKLLQRLWADVIDGCQSQERIEGLASIDSPPASSPTVVDDADYILAHLAQILDRATLQRLLRSIAYQVVFETLVAIEEEGADTSRALKSLHEDLLMADPKK